jgi:hypothetical protein
VGQNLVAVLQLHAEHGVGQGLLHDAVDFDRIFLGHILSLWRVSFQASARRREWKTRIRQARIK